MSVSKLPGLTTSQSVIPLTMPTPTTQKARGINVLQSLFYNTAHISWLLKVSEDLSLAAREHIKSILPKFARPCPPSPEHGFVESRLVTSMEELEVVRQETLAANPNSEIILMDLIKAKCNAVLTPGLLTWGPGHDGATAGKNTLSIPLVGTVFIPDVNLKEASIDPLTQDPYVEAVSDVNNSVTLTQLRAGPKLLGVSPDFIPAAMVVQQVIKTNGEDLLEWAKTIKGLKGKSGIVIWHPGGSLTDHYSVHCRENGVPIMLTAEPSIGQTLEPTTAIPPLDPHQVLEGLAVGNKVNVADHKAEFVRMALITLHNSAVMRGTHSFWVGVSVAALIKLGVSALEAEARHAHNCYQGMKSKPDIYGYYQARTLSFLRARLSRVTQILHYGFGDPNLTKSFGGRKWALCGAALVPLFNGIRKLAMEPTEESASELLLALNIAINQAHNGGWWLNKFIEVAAYDNIPKANPTALIMAADAYMTTRDLRAGWTPALTKGFVEQVKKWPETSISPIKWRKVALDVTPGCFVMNLKASTLPMPKQVLIPATPTLVKSILNALGEIRIERGRIDIVSASGEVTPVWEEIPLIAESRNVKTGK